MRIQKSHWLGGRAWHVIAGPLAVGWVTDLRWFRPRWFFLGSYAGSFQFRVLWFYVAHRR